jgi:hypothetical protein
MLLRGHEFSTAFEAPQLVAIQAMSHADISDFRIMLTIARLVATAIRARSNHHRVHEIVMIRIGQEQVIDRQLHFRWQGAEC